MAIDSAGVVLMRSNLFDILVALEISQKTFQRIRLNFVWAFGYNLIGPTRPSSHPQT